jgi:TonB family protein
MRTVCAAALLVVVAFGRADAQSETIRLTDWRDTSRGRFVQIADGVKATGSGGYIRTREHFVDFILRFELRVADDRSQAAILLRGFFGRSQSKPVSGYRVVISPPGAAKGHGVTVTSHRSRSRDVTPTDAWTAPIASGDWQRFEVRAEGDRVTIRRNDSVVSIVEGSEQAAGPVAIEAVRGTVEFRNLTVERERPNCPDGGLPATNGVLQAATPGLTLPQVVKEVKPVYTYDAMIDRVEGVVHIQAVVGTDGAVRTACVTRTLHDQLDVLALAAAKRWMFQPGVLKGLPVAVIVTIELSYVL